MNFFSSIGKSLAFAATGLAVGVVLVFYGGVIGLKIAEGLIVLLILSAYALRDRVSGFSEGNAGGADPGELTPIAREVLENLPDPLLLVETSGRVTFANRAMRALVGVDIERKHVSAVLRAPAVLEAVLRTAGTGAPASFEFSQHVPVVRHYRAYVWCTGQNPELTALLLHDLTAVKRAEEARADFIANASHELRTPLAAVSGFIDTLRGHAKDDEAAREKFLGIMSDEASRMRRLINDLLSLTRIELNEHVPPSGIADVAGIVRDAAAALAPLAEADKMTVTVDSAENIPAVTGDRDELIQLFQNLIQNAIKYGKAGGHVRVSIGVSPKSVPGRRSPLTMVSVAVCDDGEGIPREAIPRLTERFYRVDVKRSRERGGTGLGLAIVKHIVSRHQGRLQIESQPGEGSQFTVLLPAAAAKQPADAGVTELL
ncbi:MAG: PAS domain-containing protein [Proteobacteria bacterium]|nr:PAS domain-containing protein [Pseudomonadota bacterium]